MVRGLEDGFREEDPYQSADYESHGAAFVPSPEEIRERGRQLRWLKSQKIGEFLIIEIFYRETVEMHRVQKLIQFQGAEKARELLERILRD